MRRQIVLVALVGLLTASCAGIGNDRDEASTRTTGRPPTLATTSPRSPASTDPSSGPATPPTPTTPPPGRPVLARFESAGARFEVTELARDLDTVWSLAWDPAGDLWFTERGGALRRLGGESQAVEGVRENFEAGLMGLEIDRRGRKYVMYSGIDGNRVVRLEANRSQTILVRGIAKAGVHNGGRLRFGPDGFLYASTGDAGQEDLAQDPNSLNGKILRIDPESGQSSVFSRGRRNPQGLCFAPDGRLLETEHGPVGNDEVNIVTEGSDGGWPGTAGNGIRNYTPSIAPSGCAVYDAGLIPQWRGSMLFGSLRGRALRRLTFRPDGAVASEEVLLEARFGRIRDVVVGPDGAVYLATSNKDQSGSADQGDDRIVRIAPAP